MSLILSYFMIYSQADMYLLTELHLEVMFHLFGSRQSVETVAVLMHFSLFSDIS